MPKIVIVKACSTVALTVTFSTVPILSLTVSMSFPLLSCVLSLTTQGSAVPAVAVLLGLMIVGVVPRVTVMGVNALIALDPVRIKVIVGEEPVPAEFEYVPVNVPPPASPFIDTRLSVRPFS